MYSNDAEAFAYSLCASVSEAALAALLEAGGAGRLSDDHPWLLAAELLGEARGQGRRLPLILASGSPAELQYWSWVEDVEVHKLHRGRWQCRVHFGELVAVHPIWHALDALQLEPGPQRLRQERLEDLRPRRYALSTKDLRPYAVCETPLFVMDPPPATGREG